MVSIPCKYFAAGRCDKGTRCPFSHSAESALSSTNRQSPCSFFAKGTCTRSPCPFSHDSPAVSSRQICHFWQEGRCSRGPSCNYLHPTNSSNVTTRPVCTFFRKGTCIRGAACHFSHEEPTVCLSMRPGCYPLLTQGQGCSHTNKNENSAEIERTIHDFMHVKFSDGLKIEQLITGFESRQIVVSNLPSNTTKPVLYGLLGNDISIHALKEASPAGSSLTTLVDFPTVEKANAAIEFFNVNKIFGKKVQARQNIRSQDGARGKLNCSTVKIQWPAPSKVAYLKYKTLDFAEKKVAAIDGTTLKGRTVKAKISTAVTTPTVSRRNFYQSKQHSDTQVIVYNLPIDATVENVRRLAGLHEVTLTEPAYNEQEVDVQKHIQTLLAAIGDIETFSVAPILSSDSKRGASVRFVDDKSAESAITALHQKNQEFLGGGCLWVTQEYSLKYNMPLQRFRALETLISRALYTSASSELVHMKTYLNGDPVGIKLSSKESGPLLEFKTTFEKIIQGERFLDSENLLWDDFFLSHHGQDFLRSLHQKHGTLIEVRQKSRSFILFGGSDQSRVEAKEELFQKAKEQKSNRRELKLDPDMFRFLVRGGITEVFAMQGVEAGKLDILNRMLIVEGSKIAADNVARFLMSSSTRLETPLVSGAKECPVCLDETRDEVLLPCGHRYCSLCLKHQILDSRDFPLQCFGSDSTCTALLPLNTLRDFLSAEEEETAVQRALHSFIRIRPDIYKNCPTTDCEQIYRRSATENVTIQCPACVALICSFCCVEHHTGVSCKQFRESKDEEGMLRRWREEKEGRGELVKTCPQCMAWIEKNGGCNHIICASCKAHMCWICDKIFPNGPGVYGHINKEHFNRLFDEDEILRMMA
ncbi:hypothetical protein BT69DRAFT_1219344 [Atractiella rhizophila]|nr:hypothetical protein BT69DRAFT_1219344 [Atractiella rhizophila]